MVTYCTWYPCRQASTAVLLVAAPHDNAALRVWQVEHSPRPRTVVGALIATGGAQTASIRHTVATELAFLQHPWCSAALLFNNEASNCDGMRVESWAAVEPAEPTCARRDACVCVACCRRGV
jgi:hypothetical protein